MVGEQRAALLALVGVGERVLERRAREAGGRLAEERAGPRPRGREAGVEAARPRRPRSGAGRARRRSGSRPAGARAGRAWSIGSPTVTPSRSNGTIDADAVRAAVLAEQPVAVVGGDVERADLGDRAVGDPLRAGAVDDDLVVGDARLEAADVARPSRGGARSAYSDVASEPRSAWVTTQQPIFPVASSTSSSLPADCATAAACRRRRSRRRGRGRPSRAPRRSGTGRGWRPPAAARRARRCRGRARRPRHDLPVGRAGGDRLGGGHPVERPPDRPQHLGGEPVDLLLDRPLVVGERGLEARSARWSAGRCRLGFEACADGMSGPEARVISRRDELSASAGDRVERHGDSDDRTVAAEAGAAARRVPGRAARGASGISPTLHDGVGLVVVAGAGRLRQDLAAAQRLRAPARGRRSGSSGSASIPPTTTRSAFSSTWTRAAAVGTDGPATLRGGSRRRRRADRLGRGASRSSSTTSTSSPTQPSPGIIRDLIASIPGARHAVPRRPPDAGAADRPAALAGQVLEIGADELRFTAAESEQLVANILGRRLEPELVDDASTSAPTAGRPCCSSRRSP